MQKLVTNVVTRVYTFCVKLDTGTEKLLKIEAESEEAARLKLPENAVKILKIED